MDPRFGGNVGGMQPPGTRRSKEPPLNGVPYRNRRVDTPIPLEAVRRGAPPPRNYLQQQLQRFGNALQQGTDRLGREYNRTDAKYFGGALPFGVEPSFQNSLPYGTSGPGFYNMPGYGSENLPEPAGGAGFIGPRSNEILRRQIEQQMEEKRQMDQRYSAPGDLSMMMAPGTMMAGAPRYIQSPPPGGIINKAPNIDSPYIDKAIERGWKPMPAPPPRGPQLPPFV